MMPEFELFGLGPGLPRPTDIYRADDQPYFVPVPRLATRQFAISPRTRLKAAIVDSGVILRHPFIRATLVESAVFAGAGDDDTVGHGTLVALRLLAHFDCAVDLLSAKVVDAAAPWRVADVIAGIRWATDKGCDFINISLGHFGNPLCRGGCSLCTATADAAPAGAHVYVAAGNRPGKIACPARAARKVDGIEVAELLPDRARVRVRSRTEEVIHRDGDQIAFRSYDDAAVSRFLLATLLCKQGDLLQARRLLDEAQRASDAVLATEAKYNLAVLSHTEGRVDEAAVLYEMVADSAVPETRARAWSNLGRIKEDKQGDAAGAMACFDEAIATGGDEHAGMAGRLNRGLLRKRQDDREGARIDLDKARRSSDPRVAAQAGYNLAALMVEQGQLREARAVLHGVVMTRDPTYQPLAEEWLTRTAGLM